MRPPARTIRNVFLLLATLALPRGLQAQVVRGTVLDRETGAPIPMALVVVLDDEDAAVGRVLTDQTGSFIHRLQVPGAYSLRVERIGLRSEISGPVTVGAGATESVHLRIGRDPVVLPGLVVQGEERCRTPEEEGALVADLWDEARKALGMAVATEDQLGLHIRARNHERRLDIATMEVLEQRFRSWSGITRNPYLAAPPESLAEEGYVRREADGYMYFGLAAETILSRPFEDTHCFRVRGPDPDQDGQEIGLAFEPLRGRRVPDVSGVLWIDRESAELRRVEYEYTDHLQPIDLPEGVFGGRTDFRRLPDGGWIVDRWWIRMPQAERVIGRDELPRAADSRGRAGAAAGARLDLRGLGLSVLEVGGTVLSVGGQASTAVRTGTIEGQVHDSLSGGPLAGAEVYVVGTGARAITHASGTFRLPSLAPGDWMVSFHHERLDDLGYAPDPIEVRVQADERTQVELVVPSAAAILGARCHEGPQAAQAARDSEALYGFVHARQDGRPLAGIQVVAEWIGSWSVHGAPANPAFRGQGRAAETFTDAAGAWVICGIPGGAVVRVRAESGDGRRSPEVELRVQPGRGGRADFAIGPG